MAASKSPKALHETPADTSAAVEALMATLAHPHKDAIEALRKAVLGADMSIREGVKWNAPSFRTTEYFATVNLRAKAGIQVVMHLGAKVRGLPADGMKVEDPEGMLEWLGKDRATVSFADAADLSRRKAAFAKVVKAWIAWT